MFYQWFDNDGEYSGLSGKWVKIDEVWKITEISDPWSIPIDAKLSPHRIHFPTTIIIDSDDDSCKNEKCKKYVWITFGDMDCSSHMVKMELNEVIKMLKP